MIDNPASDSILTGGSVVGLIDIKNNLAPGFRVEQDGVYDDLLRVDTSTGRVKFGLQTNTFADDGTSPSLTQFYTRTRHYPWKTSSYGGGYILNGMLDIDCRSTSPFGDRPFRFWTATGFGLSNAASIYIDSGASIWAGSSFTLGARNNETNTEDGWAFLPAFYQSNGSTQLGYMFGIHSDVADPALVINVGPSTNAGYAMLVGFSNTANANTTKTADVAYWGMLKTGAQYWSAGTNVFAAELPSSNNRFDTSLVRNASRELFTDGSFRVTSGILLQQLSAPAAGYVTASPNGGTTGVTTYTYKVSAVDNGGQESAASSGLTTTAGNATIDGTNRNCIFWTASTGAVAYNIYRTTGGTTGLINTVNHNQQIGTETAWAANTAYALRDIRRPTQVNGFVYECTTAGTSHATTEPTWPTTLLSTVSDGSAVWTCRSGQWVEDIDSTSVSSSSTGTATNNTGCLKFGTGATAPKIYRSGSAGLVAQLFYKSGSGGAVAIADTDFYTTPSNGTIGLSYDSTGPVYKLWGRLNGVWKSVALT